MAYTLTAACAGGAGLEVDSLAADPGRKPRALGLAGALGIGVHPDPRGRHPRRRLGRAGAAGGGAARRAGGDLRRAGRRVRALLDPRGVRRVPVRARLRGPGLLPVERGSSSGRSQRRARPRRSLAADPELHRRLAVRQRRRPRRPDRRPARRRRGRRRSAARAPGQRRARPRRRPGLPAERRDRDRAATVRARGARDGDARHLGAAVRHRVSTRSGSALRTSRCGASRMAAARVRSCSSTTFARVRASPPARI